MKTSDIFKIVESGEFDHALQIASSISLFLREMEAHEVFVALRTNLSRSRLSLEKTAARITFLACKPFNELYANPNDTAFATYLWGLAKTHPYVAKKSAAIVQKVPQLFWAARVAYLILTGKR